MPVVGPAFPAAGRQAHGRSLCAAIRDADMEAEPQAEALMLHKASVEN
jgi:hypothetical protein